MRRKFKWDWENAISNFDSFIFFILWMFISEKNTSKSYCHALYSKFKSSDIHYMASESNVFPLITSNSKLFEVGSEKKNNKRVWAYFFYIFHNYMTKNYYFNFLTHSPNNYINASECFIAGYSIKRFSFPIASTKQRNPVATNWPWNGNLRVCMVNGGVY